MSRRYMRDLSVYDNCDDPPLSPTYVPSSPGQPESPGTMYYKQSGAKVYTSNMKWKSINEHSKVINEKISLFEPVRYKKYRSFMKSVERVVINDELKNHGELDIFQYQQLLEQSVQYFNLQQKSKEYFNNLEQQNSLRAQYSQSLNLQPQNNQMNPDYFSAFSQPEYYPNNYQQSYDYHQYPSYPAYPAMSYPPISNPVVAYPVASEVLNPNNYHSYESLPPPVPEEEM